MHRVVLFFWLGMMIFCATAFYDRYWRWRDCFNELGRCYEPGVSVLLEQAGLIWGSLAGLFAPLSTRAIRRLWLGRDGQPG